MENLGYYNGHYDLIENMMVPMSDRACAFGDGVYDATYSRNHVIFALDEHIDRIFNSARLMDINIPCNKQEMTDLLCDMVRKVDDGDQFVYWQVTRGTQLREHTYEPGIKGNLWIQLTPDTICNLDEPFDVITHEDLRYQYCNVKTLNLLPSVLYAQEAKAKGCAETILHRDGVVTECAHSNVHILKDGTLHTHPTDNLILPGIARRHLIAQCKKFEIPVIEVAFSLEDLMAADEIIITSSGALCVRVAHVDGEEVGGRDGENIARLQDALLNEFLAATAS